MASIKDLKKRIGSVKNTQQTTRAMKMVSAAKLRRAQDAIYAHRPYANRMAKLIALVSSGAGQEVDLPLLGGTEVSVGQKVLVVVVTSDRGLCGGFNGSVIKTAQRWVAENRENYEEITLGFVGRKGYDFFKTRYGSIGPYFQELSGKVVFPTARKLSESVIESYLSGQVNEVKFIYNEFKNAVTQKVVVENFLPLSKELPKDESKEVSIDPSMYLLKPNRKEILDSLLAKNFSVQAYRILLESQAGEHGARMAAMENATKNAGEMIRKLTLQYNKQRQAGITKELLEIISGAESQKSAS